MNTKLNIKDMVGGGKKVRLERVQNISVRGAISPDGSKSGGTYLVCILHFVTETGFRFEVPAEELGEAPVHPEETAMLFMKWIRRALQKLEAADPDPIEVTEPLGLKVKVLTADDVRKNSA